MANVAVTSNTIATATTITTAVVNAAIKSTGAYSMAAVIPRLSLAVSYISYNTHVGWRKFNLEFASMVPGSSWLQHLGDE